MAPGSAKLSGITLSPCRKLSSDGFFLRRDQRFRRGLGCCNSLKLNGHQREIIRQLVVAAEGVHGIQRGVEQGLGRVEFTVEALLQSLDRETITGRRND